MTSEVERLINCSRGSMVAAAGCGKTEVIANAVASSPQRQLVLTHTHAGVDAIRHRLGARKLKPSRARVDTIAGWSLRLATSFPNLSELTAFEPRDSDAYSAAYKAATLLAMHAPIRRIIRASYSAIYVDEYQDCTTDQHALIVALSEILPCRVLGDPLQAIFSFGENASVDWREHVSSHFEALSGPQTPWRWATANPALGEWLMDVRRHLEDDASIDLDGAPIVWLDSHEDALRRNCQAAACFTAAKNEGETVIAIHGWENQCHDIASRLNGLYSCVEAIDSKDLFRYAYLLDKAAGEQRALAALEFGIKCIKGLKAEFQTIRNALADGRSPRVRKHADVMSILNDIAQKQDAANVKRLFQRLRKHPGAIPYRRELLSEMERALRSVERGEEATIEAAVWTVRNRTRHTGRTLARCSVGTTRLVKGLEFNHAVVLDADQLDRNNLYVALTRGSKTLTVVSRSRVLKPSGPARRKEHQPDYQLTLFESS